MILATGSVLRIEKQLLNKERSPPTGWWPVTGLNPASRFRVLNFRDPSLPVPDEQATSHFIPQGNASMSAVPTSDEAR